MCCNIQAESREALPCLGLLQSTLYSVKVVKLPCQKCNTGQYARGIIAYQRHKMSRPPQLPLKPQ